MVPVADVRDDNSSALLVQAVQAGRPGAEEDLVRRYQGAVFSIVSALTSGSWGAEDLVQETFRVVIEKIRGGSVREPERLAGFICAVARNVAVAQRRRISELPLEGQTEPAGNPHQLAGMIEQETARIVRELVREMRPERDREILFRFYLEEQDKETICAELGLTSLHFNRVLHRARERFRELWNRRMNV